ncbi:MAG: twin-arginine translocation pathway signal [Paracoccus sp. (in: a-proteobacteria)]|nr:twin-arginine translocation pathway signal [Paracoccus sp. (in: a-proteobacteria)]
MTNHYIGAKPSPIARPVARRFFLIGAAAAGLAACTRTPPGLSRRNIAGLSGARIDELVDATRTELLRAHPGTRPIIENAKGVLYMPVMTQAGLGVGGSYGEGALRINNETVEYYTATQAGIGLQAGARQYAHVLAFQTDQALASFRAHHGWLAAAGAYYALPDSGGAYGGDTMSAEYPVVAMIFGQTGFMAGATIEGVKYTRAGAR